MQASESHYELKSESYFSNARREILPLLPRGAARALEVGCGAGHTLSLLKEQNYCDWTCGIELFSAAAEQAATRLDKVVLGNIETMDLPVEAGSIDILLCLDVLEHLVNPWETLRRLVTLLSPGGVLVASIPNVRYFRVLLSLIVHGRWDYSDDGVLDRTHLRFFTRKTAIELIESAGLSVDQVAAHNTHRDSWKYLSFEILTLAQLRPFFDRQYLIRASNR